MKKFFVLILAILFVATMFTSCDENCVKINLTIKEFYTPEQRQEYADALDPTKYQIICEENRKGDTYLLILIEKAKNETYEVFQFSSKPLRDEFREKIDSNKKVSYYEANGFLYLITVSENVIEKSTIAVKEILHNGENYIVISDADSLVTVPKSISEFIISYETNIVNLETSAGTITKATFCITKEMQDKIQ